MNEIAGVFRLDDRPADVQEVRRALRTILPGLEPATWCSGTVALGYSGPRTGSASESAGGLWVAEGGRLALVASLRLDNRSELTAALGLSGKPGISDGEVLLVAYDRWSDEFVGRIRGDFALALFDADHRVLLCARDCFGVRSLFTVHGPSRYFTFASRSRTLLEFEGVDRRLDTDSARRLLDGFPPREHQTFFRGISSVGPALVVQASSSGISEHCYWDGSPPPELHLRNDAEYEEAFLERLRESVDCRMGGGGRTGVLLSGGIDSAAIAAVAGQRARLRGLAPPKTVTAVLPGRRGGAESRRAAAAAGHARLPAEFVPVSELLHPPEDLAETAALCDDPRDLLGGVLFRLLYTRAAGSGVDIVLDGVDGDFAVSYGMTYLVDLLAERRWSEFHCLLGSRSLLRGSFLQLLFAHAQLFSALRALGTGRRNGSSEQRAAPSPAEAHARRVTSPVVATSLERLSRAAAAAGIEARHPFFDRRLVEFCLAIPARLKIRSRWTKWILRSSTRELVPDSVRWKERGSGISGPLLQSYLAASGASFHRALKEDVQAIGSLIDPRTIRAGGEAALADGSGGARQVPFLEAVALASWVHRNRLDPG